MGKGEHHAVALDKAGQRLFDKALPNDEKKLRELIGALKRHATVLFVVDQPKTIGALTVAVAYDEGVLVGYLPGLSMCRIADLHAGEAKTDARDAASNRIRGFLTQIHPALERVLGPQLGHPAVVDLLWRYPSPAALIAAGETRIANRLVKLAPRLGRPRDRDHARARRADRRGSGHQCRRYGAGQALRTARHASSSA